MEKKYQVFISSTYEDLKEERMRAIRILWENDCIPVAMEQFAASDMSQMEYIKKILDDSDYYILILAGRYGSIADKGISYIEKEFEYAISKGIPIMSFVIKDPSQLPNGKCENDNVMQERLKSFRDKVCFNRTVRYYENIGELGEAIVTSIHQCIKNHPARGWVRGDYSDQEDYLEKKMDKYTQEHTLTSEELDALLR